MNLKKAKEHGNLEEFIKTTHETKLDVSEVENDYFKKVKE